MAADEPDGAGESGGKPRRGLGWGLKRILIALVLIALIAIAIPAYHGFRPRALISEALIDGGGLRTRVAEFYEKHRRLPLDAEAKAFQMGPPDLKRAQSVVWDPAGRTIVITVGEPQPGKRVSLLAEERDGVLAWTCRTIDLEPKYLPGSCR